ncbi:uncharacterized protein A1O5_10728 [Cladophialophora psammophila CBS 110553]|uniref:MARVEL domain-containing protein n=1 Tax=Cladophialophora psammophila CBS 110553 TaxID=1182543 RepID=W9WDU7_9EURO|nr:uncharacterized protein A1O5_10728 [Cladophialophora psammophila CBS 110553]EXJ66113.1 hypothetical protein A1O5_10728 [Cladophialophora psammophila CBS 110553]
MGFFSIFSTFRKSNVFNLVFRSAQLIVALVVIGMYAVDLNTANKEDKYADSKWVFAVTVGSLAAVTALIFSLASIFFQYRTVALLFAWDWVLTILFATLSGIFGSMYIGEKVEYESGVHRMKVAVGFDFTGLILWCVTAAFGTWWFVSERKAERRGRGNKA